MDTNLVNFFISFAAGIGANLTTKSAGALLSRAFGSRPDLESRLAQPSSPAAFEEALSDLGGVFSALAGTGAISIDGAFISALQVARFDHQNGTIRIGNTVVGAPILQTGGTGTGQTVIGGNTQLKSQGTRIEIGHGAGIVMTGNAGIKQS